MEDRPVHPVHPVRLTDELGGVDVSVLDRHVLQGKSALRRRTHEALELFRSHGTSGVRLRFGTMLEPPHSHCNDHRAPGIG